MQDALIIFEQIRPWLIQLNDTERLRLIRAIAGLAPEARSSFSTTETHWLDPGAIDEQDDENLDEAVRQLRIEQEAWYRRPQMEKMRYQHEFVAVYGGEVVDHDRQRLALLRRVRQKFGPASVAILPADQDRIPEYILYHPQIVR